MKKILFTISLFVSVLSQAQDMNFSQFYELPLLRNPALAGLFKGDFRVTGAYRSQWGSVTVPYISQALGMEGLLPLGDNDNYCGIGLQLTNDKAGDSKMGRTQVLPVFTFHKSLSDEYDTYISAGFMGGFVQQRFDPSGLKFDDQFVNGSYSETNPTRQTFTNTNVTYLDGAAGIAFSSETEKGIKFYIGAAMYHLHQPKVAFDRKRDIRLNRKTMINAGMSFNMSEYNRLILYTDYFTQGGNSQAQGGMMYKIALSQTDEEEGTFFSIGSFMRWNDAIIPVFKLDANKIGIGLTYDVNISSLKSASQSRGGLEVTMSYKNYLNIGKNIRDKTRCPVKF